MNTSGSGSQQRISRLANAGSMFALACSLAASAIAGEAPAIERVDAEPHVILHDCGDRLFDLLALSGGLGLRVSRTEGEIIVQNADGREWRGAVGSPGLLTSDGYRVLSHALVEQGGALFVDRHAIEEFTWKALKEPAADDEASDAALTAARPADTSAEPLLSAASPTPAELGPPAQIAAAPIGWQSFELQKSPEELSEYERIYGPDKAKTSDMARYVNLPPQHETLNLQVGQGYVQGLDAGTDVQGSGSFAGYRANFNSQMTMGSQGFIMQTGRFSVTSPDGRWTADAGDMSSDIWGWARGARFTWNGNPKHAPTASLYAKTEPTGGFRNVIAVSDYFRLNRSLALGGELGSDGSAVVRPSFRFSRLSLSPYYRVTSDRGDSQGVYGSLRLAERVSLFGAYTKSLFEGDERVRLNAGVQVPLPRRASVRLERTKMESHYSRMALSSATVTVPVGKIRLFGRMQLRSNESLSRTGPASWRRADQSEFFGGASYFAGSRLNISYQTANRWRPDGSIHQWQQLVGSLKINRSTFLNAITVLPDDTAPSQSRIRLTRRITDDWSAILEYGNLPPTRGRPTSNPTTADSGS